MAHLVTSTSVANMALSHVRASRISSLDSGKEEEAVECRIWYEQVRLQVLQAHDWGFARRRAVASLHEDTISTTADKPLAGVWSYRYQYPADCIVIRKVQAPNSPPDHAIPFDVETSLNGKTLSVLTDQQNAVLVFTRNLETLALFSPLAIRAMTHLLASSIAYSLTGKRQVQEDQYSLYLSVLDSAATSSANEGVEAPPREADHIRARA